MKLLLDEHRAQMLANGRENAAHIEKDGNTVDHKPDAAKLRATHAEITKAESDIRVFRIEFKRDRHFTAKRSLQAYADEASRLTRINA
jgi:hypothetical protein